MSGKMSERASAPDSAAAPRILLLGSSGRLGTALKEAFGGHPARRTDPLRVHPFAPTRGGLALDPARPLEAVRRWFDEWKPQIVVNCIAMSDVDLCENETRAARALNADLPGALAREARGRNAQLIHFSTDFVFDGALRRPYREDDPANPLSVYGSTKLAGETAIESEGGNYWIFRVSWLHGGRHRNLAASLLDPSNAGRVFSLADDRIGVPNPVAWVAREVNGAIHATPAAAPGVYHLSCRGATTWYGFGREFVGQAIAAGRIAATNAPRLQPVHERAGGRPARRPEWSALDSTRYEYAFGRVVPAWRDAIAFAPP